MKFDKVNYTYKVGGIATATREAARMIQRSFRQANTWSEQDTKLEVPRIVQRITLERVVR